MAELLYEAIARERSRLFVGRERELRAVEEWLDDPKAPTAIFSVTGMGGVGKSTLLFRVEELARRRGALPVWIDGRACGRTPSGFLAYLAAVFEPARPLPPPLSLDGASGVPLPDELPRSVAGPNASAAAVFAPGLFVPGISAAGVLVSAGSGSGASWPWIPFPGLSPSEMLSRSFERTIWCIDNFEELEPIDGWLRERFFAALPAYGQLIVVASRQLLPERWRDDPGWKPRIHHFPLEPLTRSEAREYLERAGIRGPAADDLARHAGGLPLALSLAADAFDRHPEAIHREEKRLVLAVNARLMREAAGTALEPLLDVLAIVPEADGSLLAEVTGERIPTERLASLARLSFVQTSRKGFRLHDVARQYLLAELRERDAGHFRELRGRVVLALLRRLQSAPPGEAVLVAQALLAVCADALPSLEGYAHLSSFPAAELRSTRPEDLPRLHELVDMWGLQPFVLYRPKARHRILDRIVREFPETCRVVVAPGGKLIGVLVAALLWRRTAELIEAIEPGALARHFPHEHRRFASLSHEEADTYVAVAVGVDEENGEYSAAEITGVLVRDGLARLGAGTRAILGAANPEFARLLHRLGFHEYRLGPHELIHWGLRCTLYELDLRSGRFVPWVMSFLNAVDEPFPALSHEGATAALATSDLRALLAGFNDPSAWEKSPVPRILGVDPSALRSRIKEALDPGNPPPPPLEPEDREVLAQTFILERTPEAIAASLFMSRATYYRRLKRALERLRAALSFGCGTHDSLPHTNAPEIKEQSIRQGI